jgi:hypothetical protein
MFNIKLVIVLCRRVSVPAIDQADPVPGGEPILVLQHAQQELPAVQVRRLRARHQRKLVPHRDRLHGSLRFRHHLNMNQKPEL